MKKGSEEQGTSGSKEHPLVEFQRAFQQAYLAWAKELQQALAEAQSRCQEGYTKLTQNLQEQSRSATDYDEYAEAYRRGIQGLQESCSSEELLNRYTEAYRNYLRAIQGAWAQFDPNSITFGSAK